MQYLRVCHFVRTCRGSHGTMPSIHQRSRIEGRCQTSMMQFMQPLANKSTEWGKRETSSRSNPPPGISESHATVCYKSLYNFFLKNLSDSDLSDRPNSRLKLRYFAYRYIFLRNFVIIVKCFHVMFLHLSKIDSLLPWRRIAIYLAI